MNQKWECIRAIVAVEASIKESLLTKLEDMGIEAIEVHTREHLYECLINTRCAIAFVDVDTVMNGAGEIVKKVRQAERKAGKRRIPIIVCSENVVIESECLESCGKDGISDAMLFPLEGVESDLMIHHYLGTWL